MISTRLYGKEWLEAQRVEYEAIPLPVSASREEAIAKLGCKPEQLLECEFYMGARDAVIVVRPGGKKTNPSLVEKHVGDTGLRAGTEEECQDKTGLSLKMLHPFLENYVWKVMDEGIFELETIYIRAGDEKEVLKVEANALKYVIGVVNGLLAPICEE